VTTRQLYARLVAQLVAELSRGDSAPREEDAVRAARLLLRRYRLEDLLQAAVFDKARREAGFVLARTLPTAGATLRVHARALADVATVAGETDERILRAVRAAYAQGGGPSASELTGRLRAAVRATLAKADTVALTAVAGFDRAATMEDAEAAGLDRFTYAGPPGERPFCSTMLAQAAAGKTWTRTEIEGLSNGQGLSVLLYCGGYRCRHRWVPVAQSPEKQRQMRLAALERQARGEQASLKPGEQGLRQVHLATKSPRGFYAVATKRTGLAQHELRMAAYEAEQGREVYFPQAGLPGRADIDVLRDGMPVEYKAFTTGNVRRMENEVAHTLRRLALYDAAAALVCWIRHPDVDPEAAYRVLVDLLQLHPEGRRITEIKVLLPDLSGEILKRNG
jgi:hypothetical protein